MPLPYTCRSDRDPGGSWSPPHPSESSPRTDNPCILGNSPSLLTGGYTSQHSVACSSLRYHSVENKDLFLLHWWSLSFAFGKRSVEGWIDKTSILKVLLKAKVTLSWLAPTWNLAKVGTSWPWMFPICHHH